MIAPDQEEPVSTEIEVAEPEAVPSLLDRELKLEHELVVSSVKASLVAIPICVVIWVGLVALALEMAGSGNFVVALPMAGGIGIIAGAFFGTWAAFLGKAHHLEELDREVNLPPR
jgi:hypothetical protein